MDLKPIVLIKRMKFFLCIILISNCLFLNWAYSYDVQDILEPSHLLSFQYSMLHNPQPKNADPNTSYPMQEILVAKVETNNLLVSSPKYLYSKMVDILHEYECDLYLPLLSEYEHFLNHIPVNKSRQRCCKSPFKTL